MLLRAFLLLVLVSSLSGCYLMQAASGQMEVSSKRKPIAEVIANPQTPAPLRSRLEYVAAAREFASRELSLPDNESYRSYADVGRPYVVWNVFATEEFSVEPIKWCFPIAGCVVYRGYFAEDDALSYARSLRFRGYDAAVGGVAAYSTLGHFKDPILNTMLNWSDAQLAAIRSSTRALRPWWRRRASSVGWLRMVARRTCRRGDCSASAMSAS
jgi:predicted aminopeptidase